MVETFAFGFVALFALAICVSAVIAVAIMRVVGKPIAKYRPTWKTGMISCFCGYGVAAVVTLVVRRFVPDADLKAFFLATGLQAAVVFPVYAILHRMIFENRGGLRPKVGQAIVLAAVQLGFALALEVPARLIIESSKSAVTRPVQKTPVAGDRRK